MGITALVSSCEKDEGILPAISFKTGASYVSTDTMINAGTAITIGITASKTEGKDYLKKFNISKSLNGGASTTAFESDLTSAEGDSFSYDFPATVETTVGVAAKYVFTITNRDGLVNQVSLTVTAK